MGPAIRASSAISLCMVALDFQYIGFVMRRSTIRSTPSILIDGMWIAETSAVGFPKLIASSNLLSNIMDEILQFFKESTFLFFYFDLFHWFIRRIHDFIERKKMENQR
ncbi:hypothetical protein AMTRI_Chr05g59870 [Amborella trichopoda]